MANYLHNLGTFELTDNAQIYFQYQDISGGLTAPASTPQWRIFDMTGTEVTVSATNLVSAGFTGQYFADIDLDDYDGGASSLSLGKYIIKAFTTTAGLSSHAFYLIEIVAAGEKQTAINTKVDELHTDLHGPITTAGDINTLVEESVWDAAKASHAIADTMGDNTWDSTQKADILSALSVTGGYTAGEDIATIVDKVGDIEPAVLGRWEIDPVAKTLTFYEMDGVTELVVFDLKDSDSNPSTTNVHERVPQ